jgi:hypothetical protein
VLRAQLCLLHYSRKLCLRPTVTVLLQLLQLLQLLLLLLPPPLLVVSHLQRCHQQQGLGWFAAMQQWLLGRRMLLQSGPTAAVGAAAAAGLHSGPAAAAVHQAKQMLKLHLQLSMCRE